MKKQAKAINLKRASSKEILAFSLLPLGMFFINTTVGTMFNIYMTDVLKLSMTLTSIVLLGTKAWDAINDPIMGIIVEKTRTKWGKCRPYLLFCSLPLAAVTALLFLPIKFPDSMNIISKTGENLGNMGNFIYVLIMYMLYISFYTSIEIPFSSLNPLVFPEKDNRVKAVSVANTVGSLGSILPQTFAFLLVGLLGNGANNRDNSGYFLTALIFSFVGAMMMIVAFLGIREKIYIPPRQMDTKKSLKTVLSDKRINILLCCASFSGITVVCNIFLPYFARWNCIGILPMDEINNFLAGILGKNPNIDAVAILPTLLSIMSGISYMLSMLIIPRLLRNMSKKTLWIRMSLIGAAANVITYIVGIYIIPYNTVAGLVFYAVMRFFTNFPVGMSLVLIISMIADVTDDLEMTTGERLEATVYSFKGLLYKFSVAALNVVVLNIIDKLGYNAERMEVIAKDGGDSLVRPLIESTTQSSIINGIDYQVLLNAIFFMLAIIPAIGLVAQAIPMFKFKFDEDEMEERLAVYRAQKELEREEEIAKAASSK